MARVRGEPKSLYHLRIPDRVREHVDVLAADQNMTAAAQLVRLIEFGLIYDRTIWGEHRDLLASIGGVCTVSPDGGDAPLRAKLHELVDWYFDRRAS